MVSTGVLSQASCPHKGVPRCVSYVPRCLSPMSSKLQSASPAKGRLPRTPRLSRVPVLNRHGQIVLGALWRYPTLTSSPALTRSPSLQKFTANGSAQLRRARSFPVLPPPQAAVGCHRPFQAPAPATTLVGAWAGLVARRPEAGASAWLKAAGA